MIFGSGLDMLSDHIDPPIPTTLMKVLSMAVVADSQSLQKGSGYSDLFLGRGRRHHWMVDSFRLACLGIADSHYCSHLLVLCSYYPQHHPLPHLHHALYSESLDLAGIGRPSTW